MNIKIMLFINFLVGCMGYTPGLVKAPLYRYWNCIGFKNCITDNKPYQFNIGEIPLVAWKSTNNTYLSTLNICRHFGSTLQDGSIEDDVFKKAELPLRKHCFQEYNDEQLNVLFKSKTST